MKEDSSRRVIATGFGLMLLLLLIVTAIAVSNMASMEEQLEHIVNVHNLKTSLVSDMRNIARERSLALYHMALVQDPFEVDAQKMKMSSLAGRFLDARDQLFSLELSGAERRQLDEAFELALASTSVQRDAVSLMEAGKFAQANDLLMSRAIPAQNVLLEYYDFLLASEQKMSAQAADDAARTYRSSVIYMFVFGGALILLGAAISIYVLHKTALAERALRDLNAELEARVQARTEDLSKANHNLGATVQTLRETQEHLVQSEKMASLGNLVAGISHEVNTPIGISLTAASHLQAEARDLHRSFQDQTMKRSSLEAFLGHAEEACDILTQNLYRAANLIGSFKRVAVDQSSDAWHSINLHDYLDEVVTSLRPRFKNRDVVVHNDCDPAVTLYTNPGAIYQIFSNLILNSLVHAFEESGEGEIRIRVNSNSAGHLNVVYSDNGKGIPDEVIKQIFDPFFTTRRGSGGSGLGMHIVYSLVTGTLGGRITVESQPGCGSTFRVGLPLREEVIVA